MLHFYHVILAIIIYVMIMHDVGHCGMSILWTIKRHQIYGAQILFGPTRETNDKKYILWKDSIHLTNSWCYIHGIFNFDSRSDIIKPKTYITLNYWKLPLTTCSTLGIVLSIISTLTDNKPS